ncbi:hypothetical protein SAMN05444148_1815 [Winogradskyella jejuensis]|uniref:Uncharacterized protein n=1 Tax=Winogradskyella jejuensis TaxID=1089305 RepID=A0A1M5SAM5_9FLAO|nr:hypothetical protein SAMN05444148_1815 [Winogradskyella jejuensis]
MTENQSCPPFVHPKIIKIFKKILNFNIGGQNLISTLYIADYQIDKK